MEGLENKKALSLFESLIWTYLGFIYFTKDKTKEMNMTHGICKKCCIKGKYSENTTNMKAHLMGHNSN